MSEWQTMDSAPKDGTRVTLGWKDQGSAEIQDQYGPMHWSATTRNPLVQDRPGIWVSIGPDGKPLFTWREGDGGPTHWKPFDGVTVNTGI